MVPGILVAIEVLGQIYGSGDSLEVTESTKTVAELSPVVQAAQALLLFGVVPPISQALS